MSSLLKLNWSAVLSILREDALDFPEFAAKKLWMQILRHLFPDDSWVIGTEQPPIENQSLKCVDLILEHYGGSEPKTFLEVFLLAEKKPSEVESLDLQKLEEQARAQSSEYLDTSGRAAIWVMTVYGPFARLWLRTQDEFSGLYPSVDDIGKMELYSDVGEFPHTFTAYFQQMVEHLEPGSCSVEAVQIELLRQ